MTKTYEVTYQNQITGRMSYEHIDAETTEELDYQVICTVDDTWTRDGEIIELVRTEELEF